MGFLAKAFGGIKNIAKKVAGGVKAAGEAVAKAGAKVYSSFTGKDKFEEAKRIYESLRQRMELAKQDYAAFIEKTTQDIEEKVDEINSMKMGLNREHFQRFLRITSQIAHWDMALKDLPEEFKYQSLEVEDVRKREELFLIDFDKNPLKSNMKALVTLGFWSRKQAKESLHQVQEQEKVLEHELAKIDAEKARLTVVLESLENITGYFRDLTGLYGRILDELEYVVHMVKNVQYIHNHMVEKKKIDCYLFPREHLLCLMAADKMTRILFEMATLMYLSHEGEIIKSDQAEFEEKAEAADAIASKLAA